MYCWPKWPRPIGADLEEGSQTCLVSCTASHTLHWATGWYAPPLFYITDNLFELIPNLHANTSIKLMKTNYAGSSTLTRRNLSNQQVCPSNDSMCPLCYHLPGLLMAFVLPTLPLSSLVCMSAPYSVKICACAVCILSTKKLYSSTDRPYIWLLSTVVCSLMRNTSILDCVGVLRTSLIPRTDLWYVLFCYVFN